MNRTIETVLALARDKGACEKATKATSWKSLAWLFFSPQGQEFCEKQNYPSMIVWDRIMEQTDPTRYGIFVDKGKVEIRGRENVALIGETEARCYFSTPRKPHRVILMHGAKARIVATNYAVVNIVKIGNCEVKIDKDQTAAVVI